MMFRVLSPFSYCLAAAGLFMSGQTAMRAQSSVKFQVDMSVQISNGNFVPGSSTVYARGTFNNYDTSLALTTNQNGTTPTIYSGTVSITDAPGTDEAYKFYIDTGDLWESPASTLGQDRHFTLAAGAQTLPVVYFDDLPPNVPTNNVTFQVDMTQQVVLGKFVPGSSTVYARGAFDNWSTDFPLTNNPAGANTNLFSGTYAVVAPVGSVQEYKFFNTSDTYELPGQPNRRFTIAGGNQILPAVYFSDQAPGRPNVTNNVTFQVDMSAQVAVGNFTPGADSVEARGSFNNWSSGVALTNNPGGQNTNLYSGVLQIIDQAGATNQYKYVINGSGYEQPASTGGGNRSFVLLTTNGSLTLPNVFFSDATTNDLLLADTDVTFQVNMANAVGTDGHVFDPTNDTVYINGIPNFLGWNESALAPYQLTNDGSSMIYSTTLLVPRGSPKMVSYKYGINALDNEAGFGINHVRYIRSTGAYTMPLDTFGLPLVEPSFGNLSIAPSTPGYVLLSWAGGPGVHLQTQPNLNGGAWQDIPETDGLSSTNWPVTGARQFFRLAKSGSN